MGWKKFIKHPTLDDVVLYALIRAAEALGKRVKRSRKKR